MDLDWRQYWLFEIWVFDSILLFNAYGNFRLQKDPKVGQLSLWLFFCSISFWHKKDRIVLLAGRAALLGSKTETNKQTNRQTNGQRARVYEKNSQGVKSSSSSSLALVLDSSRAEACISSRAGKFGRPNRCWPRIGKDRDEIIQWYSRGVVITTSSQFPELILAIQGHLGGKYSCETSCNPLKVTWNGIISSLNLLVCILWGHGVCSKLTYD